MDHIAESMDAYFVAVVIAGVIVGIALGALAMLVGLVISFAAS